MNPNKFKDFKLLTWHVTERFESPLNLKNKLIELFPDHVPDTEHIEKFDVGFFEGRSTTANGRKWIISDDLHSMYSMFAIGSEIVLWCDAKVVNQPSKSKRPTGVDNETPVSKRAK